MQLKDGFKEENTEKESVQFHILLNNNLLFNYLLLKGSKSGKPNKTVLANKRGGGEFWGGH
jgi:hypothetical protein